MERTLRRAVADYGLDEELAPGRYQGRPPERLGLGPEDLVLVWEISTDAARWRTLTTDLAVFSSVGSPSLLRLFETGPDMDPAGAGAYLVSEYPSGGSLQSPARPFRFDEQIRAVAGAARGAHALHDYGVAHGSIGAERIFVTDRGGVLGPSVPTSPDPGALRIEEWQSIDVLDPELLRGGVPSRSTDVWALAAALHEVCSGGSLYPGIEEAQIVTAAQRVMFGTPVVAESVTPELAEVLDACFDRDPARRPATALDFADRLELILDNGARRTE